MKIFLKILKSFSIWIFAILITLASAFYQKMTGPTYPVRGHAEIGGQEVKYRLIRSYDLSDDAKVTVVVPDTSVKGELRLRRFKSLDSWQTQPMLRHGDTLIGALPHQAPAGKVMYEVTLSNGDQRVLLNDHPAVLRYTGYVPRYILFPHIFFMFMAMLFSTLTGLMVIFRGRNTYLYAWITVISVAIGGLFLGPIVQKFAFGAYWTGWPFGHDLTDNKSLVAFIFWVIALVVMKKHRENKLWPILASIVLMAVFMIPHSVLGSEIDFTKEAKTQAK
ncbi:MAG: hypothetical protein NT040_16080 [Bacteroidetes bacterium]|nr:hypothetical protein [Bacteroidota bacterium]